MVFLSIQHHIAFRATIIALACVAMYSQTLAQTPPSEAFTRVVVSNKGSIQVQSSGTKLTISSSTPGTIDANSIKVRLGNRARSITASQDGKRYDITLDKPYRVRQFLSNRGSGFDVMEETSASALPKPAEKKPETVNKESTAEVKKPIASNPSPPSSSDSAPKKPVTPIVTSKAPVKEKPAQKSSVEIAEVVKKSEPAPPKEIKPEKAALKELTETPSIQKAKIVVEPEEKKADEPKVTEKNLTDEIIPVQKEEEPEVQNEDSEELTPPSPTAAVTPADSFIAVPVKKDSRDFIKPEPLQKKEMREEENSKPEYTKRETTDAPSKPTELLIGLTPKGKDMELTFPWKHRVASALFQRDRDWWLLFSAPSVIDIEQIRSILPNNITKIDAQNIDGQTVIHFVTDGKSYMSTQQQKGSYEWQVAITQQPAPSPSSYAIEPFAEAAKPYVLVRAFDVAPSLSYTDPTYGDRITVIPSYEPNKALITSYNTPELSSVVAMQGIVMNLHDESVTYTAGRDGLRFSNEKGLRLSKNLPAIIADNPSEADTVPNIMFPYARWRVAPTDFANARIEKTQALANASKTDKPKALLDLATLYLGQGMSEEALSLINQLRDRFPDFYTDNEIAMIRAAANFMMFRMGDAASDILSPELAENPETQLWKDAISLFVPQILIPPAPETPLSTEEKAQTPTLIAPEPRFDYLAYNRNFIRYYPPKMRQKLAIIAADNFVARKEYNKAARSLDILNRDGILAPIQPYAEFLLGRIAADSGKAKEAINLWKPLANQYDDLFIHARAAFSLATLEKSEGKKTTEETIKTLERLRVVWRGDTLEEKLLNYLGQLYFETADYANALRTWKEYVSEYGGSVEGLNVSNQMAALFEKLYGDDALADTMDPLRSLALFYEFRELSPIGARGDAIIQKLADRLAKFDLLDKASALLDHQIKFRVQGEERARIGAQLAVLNLLNKKPEKALDALEASGYGASSPALAAERNRLAAAALAKLEKPEIALEMLAADSSPKGQQLRMEILWDEQDWPNVINVAEDMLGERTNIAAPLNAQETETLLKLALAYSFESDTTQLKYLRDYYSPLLKESPYKDIFDHITNNTAVLDPEDFDLITKQISQTETFLKTFQDKIADGRLSSALETSEEKPSPEEQEKIESARNKQLVPESQEATPPEKKEAPANDTKEDTTDSSPKRAPVEVAPEDNNAQEDTPSEAKEEKTQPETTKE